MPPFVDDNYDNTDDYQGKNPRLSMYAPSVPRNVDPFAPSPTNTPYGPQLPRPSAPTAPDITGGSPVPSTGTPNLPANVGAPPSEPMSPMDRMMGLYQGAEKNYQDILNKGPEQFHPSIGRRLLGFGLGALAGMPEGRGYGRYGGLNSTADPREAAAVARGFVFGPQTRLNQSYERSAAAAKSGVDTAWREMEATRQEEQDDLARRRLEFQENAPKLTTVYGPDGKSYTVWTSPQSGMSMIPFPEAVGEKPLPDTLAGQPAGGKQDPALLGRDRIASQERIAEANRQLKLDIDQRDNAVKLEVAKIRADAANNPDKISPQILRQSQTAQTIIPQMDRIMQETYDAANQLGPLVGRWNDIWTGKIGAPNAQFANYMADVDYLQSAITLAHSQGRVSNLIFEHFQKLYNAGGQSPENMIEFLKAGRTWMQAYADAPRNIKVGSGAGGGGGTPNKITLDKFLQEK